MAIDKTIKKKVIEDWQNAIPQLTLYEQFKLYKVVGPVIIGIELIKLPHSDEYRPHFVMYPLWKENAKECLNVPIILKQYYSKRNLQFNISYEKHAAFFVDALNSVKQQTILPFDGIISLRKLLTVMDDYSKTFPLRAAPHSYLQAVLHEAKLAIALFISVEEAQNILQQISEKKWDANHFERCGIDVNKWQHGLKEKLNHRTEFLNQIEINKSEKKIAKLSSSDLIE